MTCIEYDFNDILIINVERYKGSYTGEEKIDSDAKELLELLKDDDIYKTTAKINYLLFYTKNVYNWYLIHEISSKNISAINKMPKEDYVTIMKNNAIYIYTKICLIQSNSIEFQSNYILELYEIIKGLLLNINILNIFCKGETGYAYKTMLYAKIMSFKKDFKKIEIDKNELRNINERLKISRSSKKLLSKKGVFKIF